MGTEATDEQLEQVAKLRTEVHDNIYLHFWELHNDASLEHDCQFYIYTLKCASSLQCSKLFELLTQVHHKQPQVFANFNYST